MAKKQGGTFWKGKRFSKTHKKNLSKGHIGKSLTGGKNVKIMNERIEAEIKELEKQGFKCVPNTRVIPDIIATKDGKIYAIEIEYGRPNYKKYTEDISKRYDKIIWILRGKHNKQ